MTQASLDLTIDLPVAGKSPRALHASRSGAVCAVRDRGALSRAYLELLRAQGPLSDPEAAARLGRALSSICSTRNGLGADVVASESFEVTPWGTKRVRWMVAER